MNANRLVATALAALLLIGGAAAVGAAGPADQAPDDAADGQTDGASGQADADGVGPSDGLPERVPDHVRSIHETIESFLSGAIDDLGSALSGRLGGV